MLHAVTKANQMLGLIRRTFTYMDCELMKQLFTNVVRPHLKYGSVVWHPFLKQDIELLEGVQHWATKMVPGLAKLSYEERLRKLDFCSNKIVRVTRFYVYVKRRRRPVTCVLITTLLSCPVAAFA